MSETTPPTESLFLFKTPLGEVREVPLGLFLQRALPPLRHNLDPAVVNSKLAKGTEDSSAVYRNRWRTFAKNPAQMPGTAQDVVQTFSEVVAAIVKAGGVDAGTDGTTFPPTLHFHAFPESKALYADRKEPQDQFPDASLYRSEAHSWGRIVASGEHKQTAKKDDIEDNSHKVVGSMTRCIHFDPSRRFTFAYTIEDTSMRLWFCDRAQIVASESFNFIKNREPMIHFFLSLIYADPHELGWDTTMTALEDGENYDIRVDGFDGTTRTYRTVRPLILHELDKVRHTRTHVWMAVPLEDGETRGDPVVLKDTWVAADHMAEGFILEQILNSVCEKEDYTELEACFPTVLFHGDVFSDTGRTILDCTRSLSSDVDIPVDFKQIAELHTCRSAEEHDRLSKTSSALHEPPRIHYRLVSKEIGKQLGMERNPDVIFGTLIRVARILQYLHTEGWVHHDVSVGNILVFDGHAMLSDFECAQKMGLGPDCARGTPGFSAVEVASRSYAFRPVDFVARQGTSLASTIQFNNMLSGTYGWDNSLGLRVVSQKVYDKLSKITGPFRYNALHDLESLWWVAMYFVLKRQLVVVSETGEKARILPLAKYQRQNCDPPFEDEGVRYGVLATETKFEDWTRCVNSILQWPVIYLGSLRSTLVNAYCEAEVDVRLMKTNLEIHDTFAKKLAEIIAQIPRRVELHPFSDEPIPSQQPPRQVETPIRRTRFFQPPGFSRWCGNLDSDDEEEDKEEDDDVDTTVDPDEVPRPAKRRRTTTEAPAEKTKAAGRTRPHLPRKAKARYGPRD